MGENEHFFPNVKYSKYWAFKRTLQKPSPLSHPQNHFAVKPRESLLDGHKPDPP